MTAKAFGKIKAGLEEALAVSRGEVTGARLNTYLNGRKLTDEEQRKALRIGRIQFKSAGQVRSK